MGVSIHFRGVMLYVCEVVGGTTQLASILLPEADSPKGWVDPPQDEKRWRHPDHSRAIRHYRSLMFGPADDLTKRKIVPITATSKIKIGSGTSHPELKGLERKFAPLNGLVGNDAVIDFSSKMIGTTVEIVGAKQLSIGFATTQEFILAGTDYTALELQADFAEASLDILTDQGTQTVTEDDKVAIFNFDLPNPTWKKLDGIRKLDPHEPLVDNDFRWLYSMLVPVGGSTWPNARTLPAPELKGADDSLKGTSILTVKVSTCFPGVWLP